MSSLPTAECPTNATLAAFVDGDLDAETRLAVLAHIERCRECMAAVLSANAQLREERAAMAAPATRWWLAVAAAALLAILAGPWLLRRDDGSIHRLVTLAPRSARTVEPRLTGGFAWAAYAGANRAAGETKDAQQRKLDGAAGELVERADKNGNADAQHAAGVALVLVQDPVEAIGRLEAAAKKSNDPKAWSDLAAARYAAASQLGRASLYPLALGAAETALRLDPNLAEALFNRALILERLGLEDDAKRAWQRYLEVDPSSQWAAEARSRLAQLPAATHSSQFERDRPLLERAAEHGDTAALRRAVDAHRERARAWGEGECLARWAEALQRDDAAEAARSLSVARGIGAALAALSGETMLRDAVRAIDGASPQQQRAIAAAQLLYRNGRAASAREQRGDAQRDLGRAADAFDALHDPMALQARFYAASARLAANDAAAARADLERVLAAANRHPEYISLGAYIRWELGRALCYDDNWSGAATVFTDGAAMFHRAGERVSEGFTETNLAFALNALGRDDDAWLARAQAFDALSAEGDAERLATSIGAAAYAELGAGHRDAALALSSLPSAVARGGAHPHFAINALINRALLRSTSGNGSGALQSVREAEALADALTDPEVRGAWSAKVAVARGAALAESSPSIAAESLTRAIDFYTAHQTEGALLDPLLLRARCAARRRDVPSAMRDLERGMTIVQSHPAGPAGSAAGWSILDAEREVFTDAIRLSLDRGDPAAAFGYAERSRGTPAAVGDLRRRLAGTGTAVLEIVALSDELVTFAVAENDAVVVRRATSIESLVQLAGESLSETGTTAAAKLYDELIRPAGSVLDRADGVVVIADQRLESVPFAALYDSVHRRYLIERFPVATASSAGSLQPDEAPITAPALAAIALPSGGADSTALPETGNEVRDVAGIYARATSVHAAEATFAKFHTAAAGADIVHIAGHTERQPGGGEQALLFAGDSGTLDRVSWKTILASPARNAGVIVLAACETLRPPPSAATRALSLGAAFLAAGASDVIGTLAPIGDRDARTLFGALHRHLAAGQRPAAALRAAQLEAIASERNGDGRHSWRAVALLTRRIPSPLRRKELLSWLTKP